MNWTGQNPYSLTQWLAGHYQYGVNWIPDQIFPYPIPLSIFMAPIGILPIREAFVLWMYFSELAIIISILLIMSSSDIIVTKHFFIPVLVGAFLFRPVLLTLGNGQLSAFILLNLTLIVWLWKQQKWWQGSCLLALLWLKPTVGGPIIALLCLYLWKQGHRKSLAGFFLASGLLAALGFIQDRDWIFDFLASGQRKLSETFGISPSYWGIASTMCDRETSCLLIVGALLSLLSIVIIGYVIWHYSRTISPALIISGIIPVALLLTPYGWAYDHILLIIPITVIISKMVDWHFSFLSTSVVFIFFSILSWLLLGLAFVIGHDSWSAIVPVICLTLVLAIIYQDWREPIRQQFLSRN